MMRGGRGRNRGRGRGDMVMDDDHHGDMDNGVNFHSSSPVMFTRSLSTLIVFFLLFKTMVVFFPFRMEELHGAKHMELLHPYCI